MQVRPEEIDYKKKIGHLGSLPVMELGLKGGYHIICSVDGPKIDYLGVGPHRAVARYMAKKRKPDIEITELSKSDWVDPALFQHQLPEYERLLDQMRALSDE